MVFKKSDSNSNAKDISRINQEYISLKYQLIKDIFGSKVDESTSSFSFNTKNKDTSKNSSSTL